AAGGGERVGAERGTGWGELEVGARRRADNGEGDGEREAVGQAELRRDRRDSDFLAGAERALPDAREVAGHAARGTEVLLQAGDHRDSERGDRVAAQRRAQRFEATARKLATPRENARIERHPQLAALGSVGAIHRLSGKSPAREGGAEEHE